MLSTGTVSLCMSSELPRFEEIVAHLPYQTQKKTRMWPVRSNRLWNSLEHVCSQPCVPCDQGLLTASFSGTNVPGNKQHIHTQSSKWLSSCMPGLGDCFPFGRQEWVLGGTKARSWLTTLQRVCMPGYLQADLNTLVWLVWAREHHLAKDPIHFGMGLPEGSSQSKAQW